jgi:hypothetical protein
MAGLFYGFTTGYDENFVWAGLFLLLPVTVKPTGNGGRYSERLFLA